MDPCSIGSYIMWPKSFLGHDKSSVMNQCQVVYSKMLIWPASFNEEIYILNRLIKSFNLSFIKRKKTVPWSWFNVSMPILFRTVFLRIIPHSPSHGHIIGQGYLNEPCSCGFGLHNQIIFKSVRPRGIWWPKLLGPSIPKLLQSMGIPNWDKSGPLNLQNYINRFNRKQLNAKLQMI